MIATAIARSAPGSRSCMPPVTDTTTFWLPMGAMNLWSTFTMMEARRSLDTPLAERMGGLVACGGWGVTRACAGKGRLQV